jgi:uncharacterized protein YkwD
MIKTEKFPVANIYVPAKRRASRYILVLAALTLAATPASALDLNSYRAQHGRPALGMSGTLAGLAAEQANSMANRSHLDHAGFRQRFAFSGSTHAENVAYGCADEDCVIRMWSRSGGHRANMLRRDVSAYGIASATGANGRRYWALELGN